MDISTGSLSSTGKYYETQGGLDGDSGHAYFVQAIEYPIAILNILTDLALWIIPCALVWNLQMKREKRFWVIISFSTRLLYVLAIIVVYFFSRAHCT